MSNIKSTTEQALADFDSGLNYCQATLASLCETALDRETALKISMFFFGKKTVKIL